MIAEKELVTAGEVAKKLKMTPATIRRLANEKKIPSLKIGSNLRFNFKDLFESFEK